MQYLRFNFVPMLDVFLLCYLTLFFTLFLSSKECRDCFQLVYTGMLFFILFDGTVFCTFDNKYRQALIRGFQTRPRKLELGFVKSTILEKFSQNSDDMGFIFGQN